MKRLIVNASTPWIDRSEIKPGDAIICSHPIHLNAICIYVTAFRDKPAWQVLLCSSGDVFAEAEKFTDFFTNENSTGEPLHRWKFHKID